MFDTAAQLGIMLFGSTAVLLVGSRGARWRRWGYVSGLCGEPFWLYSAWQAGQWGVVIMVLVYGIGWVRGIYNHFGSNSELTSEREVNLS